MQTLALFPCAEAGAATEFLPFNRGDDGAAGNPVNPAGGHRTAYLWAEVWERESWLEILGRYFIAERDKGRITNVIFPRYHQLDVTRKLQAAVLAEGTGGKYLIQHSAGSGKTNSIAWTAHFFAELHDAQNKKAFYPVSDLFRFVSDDIGLQVDFLGTIHGIRSFESLRSRAVRLDIGGTALAVAALADIVKSKRAAGRPKDYAVLAILETTLDEAAQIPATTPESRAPRRARARK